MTETTKTLLVQLQDGKDRKIVIPEDWVITFGPIGVGSRHDGNSTHVLRLYADAGKKHLKAVFRNVVAFHEEGIEILEKVTRRRNKTFKKRGQRGEQTYAAEVRQTSWEDPFADEPDAEANDFEVSEDALSLPGSTPEPF